MRWSSLSFLLIMILFIPAVSLQSATIYVPGDYPKIQGAINAALPGDTIIVGPGTYVENVDFIGKAITVRSTNGPEATIINGNQSGSVVTFHNGEYLDSVLDGFTLRNGSGAGSQPTDGGGIDCLNASPTIKNNIITSNHAFFGGGISCGDSSPVITGNTVSDNTAIVGAGMVVFGSAARPLISGNTISGNVSENEGGGIDCGNYASPMIIRNLITGNSAATVNDFGGAGVLVWSEADALIAENIITGNTSGAEAGGIWLAYDGYAVVSNNIITGNDGYYGGGICCSFPITAAPGRPEQGHHLSPSMAGRETRSERRDGDRLFINNLVAGNTAFYGGGIYHENTETEFRLQTVHGNHAYSSWGGVDADSDAVLTDCIVRDNTPSQIGYDPVVLFSDIQGGYAGTGNIDLDPLYTGGPLGDYYLAHTATGQPADSPCLDAGSALAANICFMGADGTMCADQLSTRIDHLLETGLLDMGFHPYFGGFKTVGAELVCRPNLGTIPFGLEMFVTLMNKNRSETRRVAGRIDVDLPGGQHYSNWRSGWSNITAGGEQFVGWLQWIPELGNLIGENRFTLSAMDVTPSPYNQPPRLPSGDTGHSVCTITAHAP